MSKRRRRGEDSSTAKKIRLGEFTYFSDTIHARSLISFKCPALRMQRAVVETMLNLNGREEPRQISVSGLQGEIDGKMGFEVGIANGVFFDRLDEVAAGELVQYLASNGGCRVLDFLIIATYHYRRGGRMLPVRFDHHHLRFSFEGEAVEVLLHHARGTRRLPLDELFQMIFEELRRWGEKERLGEVRVEMMRTL